MKYIMLLLVVLFSTVSCDKQEQEATPELLQGMYTGQFIRLSAVGNNPPANVTLTLENGQFTGASESAKYPAICRGTYSLSGDEVEFFNECFWTAEFDWTLILSGKYRLSSEGDTIILTRTYEGGTTDRYTLKKKD